MMIYKIAITVALLVAPFAVQAQQSKKFLVEQICEPVQLMAAKVMLDYGEQPLFGAKGIQFSAVDGEAYKSDMMYFVNQDTGTWTLISLYGDGIGCMVATGNNFKPYSGPVGRKTLD